MFPGEANASVRLLEKLSLMLACWRSVGWSSLVCMTQESDLLSQKSLFCTKYGSFIGNIPTFTCQSPVHSVSWLFPPSPHVLIARVDYRTGWGGGKRRRRGDTLPFLPPAVLKQAVFGVQELQELIHARHCLQAGLVIWQRRVLVSIIQTNDKTLCFSG